MIVSPEILQGVLRGEQPTLGPFLDRACVVLALERETAPAYAKLMKKADGWVMVDDQMDRLAEIVMLSLSGHCTVPRSIDTSGQLDSLMRSGVEQLTPEECVVLAELGYGRSDNAIINRLGKGKSEIRALVQSIVTKLRVSNRIEAGAVAVKHKLKISRMRQRSISALAVTLILLSWAFVSISGAMVAIVR
jgi:DNA-binding NarL/FixJ family response regulator